MLYSLSSQMYKYEHGLTAAEQRAADVSVNYPGVVQNYRSAREIVLRHGKGQSTTEDLRQAMVCFRSLFEELLDSPKPEKIGVSHERIAS